MGYTILADGSADVANNKGNYFIFSSSDSSPTVFININTNLNGGNFTTYKNQMLNLINGNTISSIKLENVNPIQPQQNRTIQFIRVKISTLGVVESYSIITNNNLLTLNNPLEITGLEEFIDGDNYYLCIILTNFSNPVYIIPCQVKATVQYA